MRKGEKIKKNEKFNLHAIEKDKRLSRGRKRFEKYKRSSVRTRNFVMSIKLCLYMSELNNSIKNTGRHCPNIQKTRSFYQSRNVRQLFATFIFMISIYVTQSARMRAIVCKIFRWLCNRVSQSREPSKAG